MSPQARDSSTPPDAGAGGSATIVTGASRAWYSQAASRMVLGESEAPATATAVTGVPSAWSRTAASCIRQLVSRVQARSVSPAL